MAKIDKHQRPAWVYAVVVLAVLVVVAFVVIHLTIGSPFAHGAS